MVMETDQALLEGETDATASAEPDEQQAEADPQAEMAARLTGLEAEITRLKTLDPSKIGPAIGRVAALQSQLDAIKDRNPSADLDPRISANENLTVTLAQALANSDLVDDRFKQSLNTALQGIEQAGTERKQRQLKESLKEEIAKELSSVQPVVESSGVYDPWKDASAAVFEAADEARVVLTDDNFADFLKRSGGSPARAVRLAEQWIQNNKTDPATTRVAERQRAAGNGSPARSAAAPSHADIIERYANGDPSLTSEEADKAMKALGL